MNILRYTLLSVLLSSPLAAQTTGNAEAYSRIYRHRDGTRTESFKNGDKCEIQEFTYNKNNILQIKRLFVTDTKGRCRAGYIWDGKQNPLGSIAFGFDPHTDQLVEERQFNRNGKLVRRLFYPGALKAYGNRFVALNYDPDNPNAAPVESKENVKPVRPVESEQDEFEPGIPIGKSVPAANGAPAANSQNNTTTAPAGRRKRFFAIPGSTVPPATNIAPPPPAVAPTPPPPRAAPPTPPPASATPPAAPAPAKRAPARKPQT
jgi:hypothetical protein